MFPFTVVANKKQLFITFYCGYQESNVYKSNGISFFIFGNYCQRPYKIHVETASSTILIIDPF